MNKYFYIIILTLLLSNSVFAQIEKSNSVFVSGIVKDSLNNPLKGVNIIIKNTRIGTVVDENGNYKIDLTKLHKKEKKIVVIFSFVGFKIIEKEIDISDSDKNKIINIVLKDKAAPLSCNG
ncbi:carboxypeptidase-like regulatory domain-containing protein [Algibacter luteus]|uniref:CarboxypepD_reg-like domain-containing protein n=1 Tax=Algibacter luteus TaxID=1178825 RepID=A0A1M6ABF0_9FLAO|nr:carboxypeptidase-like regulatory domain-containing protein [Algibacter luteus]SHI33698.1 CarboxypepD_reg-like domain-containing protein [Algibacter luteus]